MSLQVGEMLVRSYKVSEKHLASFVGSGSVPVLSTPSMILFMEEVSNQLIERFLPETKLSVGVHICVDHKKAVKENETVEISSTISKVDGNKVELNVVARYQGFVIGEGTHVRFIVDKDTFLNKLSNA